MIQKIIFPTPPSSYDSSLPGIGKFETVRFQLLKIDGKIITYLYLTSENITQKKLMLYFHGNSEDLGSNYFILQTVGEHINANVMAIEYPGYGIAEGKPSDKEILIQAEMAFQHCIKTLKYAPEDIAVVGRSLGSGPACHIAEQYKPGALLLISPLSSVKAVAGSKMWIAKFFVKQRFPNIKKIKNIKSPTLIIHGKKDPVIPYKQSQDLHKANPEFTKLILVDEMTHNQFSLIEDIFEPFRQFLLEKLDDWKTKL